MEIEQYLYDLTEAGEAIVAYSMVSTSGAKVQLCNMGASILSFTVAGGDDILTGSCTKGLIADRERFEERLWESRVEVNRVVMSLAYECEGVGVVSEVVFDFDDDDSLEITYQAYLEEGDLPFDLTHKMSFNLGGAMEVIANGAVVSEGVHSISAAQRGILSEVATLKGELFEVAVLSSHPALQYDGESTLSTLTAPAELLQEGVRFVQKSLFRPSRV